MVFLIAGLSLMWIIGRWFLGSSPSNQPTDEINEVTERSSAEINNSDNTEIRRKESISINPEDFDKNNEDSMKDCNDECSLAPFCENVDGCKQTSIDDSGKAQKVIEEGKEDKDDCAVKENGEENQRTIEDNVAGEACCEDNNEETNKEIKAIEEDNNTNNDILDYEQIDSVIRDQENDGILDKENETEIEAVEMEIKNDKDDFYVTQDVKEIPTELSEDEEIARVIKAKEGDFVFGENTDILSEADEEQRGLNISDTSSHTSETSSSSSDNENEVSAEKFDNEETSFNYSLKENLELQGQISEFEIDDQDHESLINDNRAVTDVEHCSNESNPSKNNQESSDLDLKEEERENN